MDTNINSKEMDEKKEVVRDEHGRVVSGVLNPNGRPKNEESMTNVMRQFLDEKIEGAEVTRREALVRKIVDMAYKGDTTAIKLIWNYSDGLPKASTEIEIKNPQERLRELIDRINNDNEIQGDS